MTGLVLRCVFDHDLIHVAVALAVVVPDESLLGKPAIYSEALYPAERGRAYY